MTGSQEHPVRDTQPAAPRRVSPCAHGAINRHLLSIYQFLTAVIVVQTVTSIGLAGVVRR